MNTFDIEDVIEESDEDSIFGLTPSSKITRKQSSKNQVTLPLYSKEDLPKSKQNTRYFYTDEDCGIRITLTPYLKKRKQYLTTKDRHITNHFGRPFSSIAITTYERTIFLKGDTLTVKTNHYCKSRYFNCKYFRKNWSTQGFSINLKTGNFVTFSKDNINSKFPRVRRNVFAFLIDTLSTYLMDFNTKINYLTDSGGDNQMNDLIEFRKKFKENFNDIEFIQTLYSFFSKIPGFKLKDLPHSSFIPKNTCNWLLYVIVDLFVKIKGIKVPNNFYALLVAWYPTQKFLKKNDNKLVASILDRLGIKTKQTIRIIHENPEMDIMRLYSLVKYFGIDDFHRYLGNLDVAYFRGKNPIIIGSSEKRWFPVIPERPDPFHLSNNEKSNILKLLNELTNHNINVISDGNFKTVIDDHLRSLDDHINMIRNVKEFFPDVSLNTNNWKSFHEEHLMLSRLQGLIRKGYATEYVFEDDLVNYIESPIFGNDHTFYPVLLKKDVEYTEEGRHMHHCVGSYSDDDTSIIISLRMGSSNGDERVTCQFNTRTKKEVQSRYFCNKIPPDCFTDALVVLYKRIDKYSLSIRSKDKIRTPMFSNKENKPIEELVMNLPVDIFGNVQVAQLPQY
jgi:hypothetical protein